MPRFIIRYTTKPEATQQNAELIENVFRELHAAAPEGVHYAVLQDGDAFFHLVAYEDEADNERLTASASFRAFAGGGEARRATPPVRSDVRIVGNYGLLAK